MRTSGDGNAPLVVLGRKPVRPLGRLDLTLGEDLLDNLVVLGGAKDGVEVLLAGALHDALRALAGVEDVEGVDDVDERDRAAGGAECVREELESLPWRYKKRTGLQGEARESVSSPKERFPQPKLTTAPPLLGSCALRSRDESVPVLAQALVRPP